MSWKRLQDKKLQKRLRIRARVVQAIRGFFVKEGFLEVETPVFTPYAGQEPYLNPFKTECADEQGRKHHGYLITSPEYAHKKLLAAGFKKTFEITRAFRAGEHFGGLHNPEFTILEWYRAHADYTKIMEDVEKMAAYIITSLKQENIKTIEYQGKGIDFSPPWERLTVREAFKKYADADLDEVQADDTFFKIFLTQIEPKLGLTKPTILYEYPARMAALARIKAAKQQNNRTADVAERFELYIAGMELANAFSELTDAQKQRVRFLSEQKMRKKLGKKVIPLDEDFLEAVGCMPPSAGIALGVDRLVMLLTNAKNIEEVLTFPAKELWGLS
ncbi:EF-P lysine aminoacylase GenX [Candidatus Uhrbacteria bacterium]|nr:EF-P lysine aminoacylase GenX [Candidatus Uhrbacteria bacterium]